MICNLLLSCSVLLLSCSRLLAHPVTDTADRTYSGLDSVELAGVISPDDLTVSDLNDLLQRAAVVGYPPQLSRESETHSSHTDVCYLSMLQKMKNKCSYCSFHRYQTVWTDSQRCSTRVSVRKTVSPRPSQRTVGKQETVQEERWQCRLLLEILCLSH
ncbi:urotensin 2, alpha isoform X1 [Pimephales promelas]|uniref:urotensin 2, alpha isoform X1 n=1 Tax=Pimephales promelas TaxID=90988 RepID=UPI001955D9D5|nr:urotensin 2, alpha isoform X1 [Pimephales promelas]